MNVFRLISLLLITLTLSSEPAQKKRRFVTIPDQEMKSSHTAVIASASATVLGVLAITISKSRKSHQPDEKATQLPNDGITKDKEVEEGPDDTSVQQKNKKVKNSEPTLDQLITKVQNHKSKEDATDINKAIGLLLEPNDIPEELRYLAKERNNVVQKRQVLEAKVKLAEQKQAARKQQKTTQQSSLPS